MDCGQFCLPYLKRNIPEERRSLATPRRKPEMLHIVFFYYAVNPYPANVENMVSS